MQPITLILIIVAVLSVLAVALWCVCESSHVEEELLEFLTIEEEISSVDEEEEDD